METLDPATVNKAYDLSMLPPDLVADGDDDPDTVNADAAAILSTTLIAEAGTGADVKLVIEENGIAVGALTLNLKIGGDGKVRDKTRDTTQQGVADERSTRSQDPPSRD